MKVLEDRHKFEPFQKHPIPTPWKVIGNSEGGRGVSIANLSKGNY